MVKKLFAALLLLLLIPAAALAETQVYDQADLFTVAEVQQMEELIAQIESEHQIDMVVLTTNRVRDDYTDDLYYVRNYADDFYDQGGFGMGEDNSGMLIMIDMRNRVMWLSTGGVMIDYINDSREDAILDACYAELRGGDYGDAVIEALEMVERYMNKGRAEGAFRYDEATGRRLGGVYNTLTGGELLVAAAAGGGTALAIYLCVSSAYRIGGQTYRYDRAANTSLMLTRNTNRFLHRTVTRTARHQSSGGGYGGGRSGGGSGVHRSSGGRSHGGGGRRF